MVASNGPLPAGASSPAVAAAAGSAVTCADCGLTQLLPPLPPRSIAECRRCDRLLDRRAATSLALAMACAAAAFALLFPAALLPLLQSTIRNLVFEETRLISSVPVIYRDVW